MTLLAFAAAGASANPDVIVGDLPNFTYWGTYNGIAAFSIGTTSCNIGDSTLSWVRSTNRHPVIAQNLYRYKVVNGAGQFDQIGASFLKHGFTALNGTVCGSCATHDNTGDTLDPTCSDPYDSSLNGDQTRLGPRSQVNAFTGVYPYPFTAAPLPASNQTGLAIARRMQVKTSDILAAQNPGALFYAEGHYIAWDDAQAGNGLNNASYRRVAISGTSSFTMTTVAGQSTFRQKPAIYGWQAADSGVNVSEVAVPGEGRFYVGSRVTHLTNGLWHYEYAVFNMNSDRSAGSFTLNLRGGDWNALGLTNIGFHDVDCHSGEPYSTTDWTPSFTDAGFGWSTQSFDQNQNANAIRWSTMYSFRFDSERAPMAGSATIGLFKPGADSGVNVSLQVPSVPSCLADFNVDGAVDGSDVEAFFAQWENGMASADLNQDGGIDGADVDMFYAHWEGGC